MPTRKLELIPMSDVPKKGGHELEARPARRAHHASEAATYTFMCALTSIGVSIIGYLLYLNPWALGTAWFFPIMTFSAVLGVAGLVSFDGANCHIGNYLNEGNPQYCLPEDSSPREAVCEIELRKAVVQYNALAHDWNTDTAEECEEEFKVRAKHRILLATHRKELCEWIQHLRDGNIASLPEPEPAQEPHLRPRAISGHGLLGPSSLYK